MEVRAEILEALHSAAADLDEVSKQRRHKRKSWRCGVGPLSTYRAVVEQLAWGNGVDIKEATIRMMEEGP